MPISTLCPFSDYNIKTNHDISMAFPFPSVIAELAVKQEPTSRRKKQRQTDATPKDRLWVLIGLIHNKKRKVYRTFICKTSRRGYLGPSNYCYRERDDAGQ
jgi:hypothetical protein